MPTYVVDETPLDHPAGCWRLLVGTQRRPLPGVRAVEVSVPGVPGELAIVGEEVEPTTLGLTLGVYGRDARGAPGGRRALEANLEALAAVFDSSRRLLDVRWRVDELVERQAWAKVVAASEPEVFNTAAFARLSVVLRIPGVWWRDVPEETSTWSTLLADAAGPVPVGTLADSSAPCGDAVFALEGGAMDHPYVVDVATGARLTYAGTLTGSQRLVVDCGRMRAALVAPGEWSVETGSTVTGRVDVVGPGSDRGWLALTPAYAYGDPHARDVRITAGAVSAEAGAELSIRARRAYR